MPFSFKFFIIKQLLLKVEGLKLSYKQKKKKKKKLKLKVLESELEFLKITCRKITSKMKMKNYIKDEDEFISL